MYRTVIATAILFVMSSTASAQLIFCPIHEVVDWQDGWSDYYGEYCSGGLGNETLPTGASVPTDCNNQSNCFNVAGTQHIASLSSKFYSGSPKILIGKLVVDQNVRVRKDDQVKYFKFVAVLVNDIRVVSVAREIAKPEGRIVDLEHKMLTESSHGRVVANFGGIVYQVRTVNAGPRVARAQD